MKRLLFAILICPSILLAETYSFNKVVNLDKLDSELRANMDLSIQALYGSEIVDGYADVSENNLFLTFYSNLSAQQEAHLADIVSSHTATASAPPVKEDFTFDGYNSTLGSGTTFQTFRPRTNISITGIAVTIVTSGGLTDPHVFKCGTVSDPVAVTVPGDAQAGQTYVSSGDSFVMAGSTVSMWLDTVGIPTYTVNQQCTYILQ